MQNTQTEGVGGMGVSLDYRETKKGEEEAKALREKQARAAASNVLVVSNWHEVVGDKTGGIRVRPRE